MTLRKTAYHSFSLAENAQFVEVKKVEAGVSHAFYWNRKKTAKFFPHTLTVQMINHLSYRNELICNSRAISVKLSDNTEEKIFLTHF